MDATRNLASHLSSACTLCRHERALHEHWQGACRVVLCACDGFSTEP